MKKTLGIILMIFCLTGCSEMRVIGSAAMRELHADAIPVNWTKTEPQQVRVAKKDNLVRVADLKVKSFSSFRSSPSASKKPVKGLWEQGVASTKNAAKPDGWNTAIYEQL